MSDVLDLTRVPAERDLPPGRLTKRKQMLLAEITVSEAVDGLDHGLRSRLRRIAAWFACLFAVVLVGLAASRAEIRPIHADHVAQGLAAAGAGAVIATYVGAARSDSLHLAWKTPSESAGSNQP